MNHGGLDMNGEINIDKNALERIVSSLDLNKFADSINIAEMNMPEENLANLTLMLDQPNLGYIIHSYMDSIIQQLNQFKVEESFDIEVNSDFNIKV